MINLKDIESRQGALDALAVILQAKNGQIIIKRKSGHEKDAIDNNTTTTLDGLKLPQNVKVVSPEPEDETQEEAEERGRRLKLDNSQDQIEKDLNNVKNELDINQQELERQRQAEIEERSRKAAEDRAKQVSKGKAFMNFYSEFEKDLEDCVMEQIYASDEYNKTFDEVDTTYYGTEYEKEVLSPGRERIEKWNHPYIQVYFDLSGSVDASDINNAMEMIDGILRKLWEDDQLDYEFWYFASNVSKDPHNVGGGTTAYPKLLQNVIKTEANNVIIFTDSDFDRQTSNLSLQPDLKLDGCVWWIWVDEQKVARKSWRHLVSYEPLNTRHDTLH